MLKTVPGNIGGLNLLVNRFNRKNPAFAEGYHPSDAVGNSCIRHSGIEGVIKKSSAGTAVEGVTIIREGKKKITLSNNKGIYKLIMLKAGDMKIIITAPGYEPQVVDIKILRGKIIELNISLQAQVISMATA